MTGEWWHAYGGIVQEGPWEGAIATTFFGPTNLGPDDKLDDGRPVRSALGGSPNAVLPYLDTFDHEPSDEEREQVHAIASWPRIRFDDQALRDWLRATNTGDLVEGTWGEACGLWWKEAGEYVETPGDDAVLMCGDDPFSTDADHFYDRVEQLLREASKAGLFGGPRLTLWQTASGGDLADGTLLQIDVPLDPERPPVRLACEEQAGGLGIADTEAEGLDAVVFVLGALAASAQAEIDRTARTLVAVL